MPDLVTGDMRLRGKFNTYATTCAYLSIHVVKLFFSHLPSLCCGSVSVAEDMQHAVNSVQQKLPGRFRLKDPGIGNRGIRRDIDIRDKFVFASAQIERQHVSRHIPAVVAAIKARYGSVSDKRDIDFTVRRSGFLGEDVTDYPRDCPAIDGDSLLEVLYGYSHVRPRDN